MVQETAKKQLFVREQWAVRQLLQDVVEVSNDSCVMKRHEFQSKVAVSDIVTYNFSPHWNILPIVNDGSRIRRNG
jgi:hypothetical protein